MLQHAHGRFISKPYAGRPNNTHQKEGYRADPQTRSSSRPAEPESAIYVHADAPIRDPSFEISKEELETLCPQL